MNYLSIAYDYILNNTITIDKSFYISVIGVQLTIYGILLTFYQFLVTYNPKDNKLSGTYLGEDVLEYYIRTEMKSYRLLKSKLLVGLLIIEILLKPYIDIFALKLYSKTTNSL